MKKLIFLLVCFATTGLTAQQSQTKPTESTEYRASYPKTNQIVHTKLDVRFDIPKSIMYGKAWLTVQPHFYPVDSLLLDTKYMDIKEVSIVKGTEKKKLQYKYDSLQLHIALDKTYKKEEKYTVYIDYIARPEEVKAQGSEAITDAKGLYFINPDGKGRWPTQIWTQGETEANSVWMPIIDKPNQKTTQEIAMTVPDKYMTLSNGTMTATKKNPDGTRTDTWKLDKPHAPYLFFMGVMGKDDFVVVKDSYKNIPVEYYVEKEYASVARGIFGETPKMIAFFSEKLNFPYVWPKYAQMVGREYVSGAMENTTATLHQDGAYQNARQLVDGNSWEGTIAHELFHHWFGDLTTAESWSNLTVNESFANYSQYLWDEFRHGRDYADDKAYEEMEGYLLSNSSDKDLVRFYYNDKEDMFDAVSYNKGGRILHMLRTFVGDDAFFASLNKYLTDHQYQSAEAHDLRLAFESVTGEDMNWFWNEWYFGSGQPQLEISYKYEDGKVRVIVDQTQEGRTFTLPVHIDVYSQKDQKTRYKVWLRNTSDTFYFPSTQKPSWVNFDADKALLALKIDRKSAEEYEQQYQYGPRYLDRKEALEFLAAKGSNILVNGLDDSYAGLRRLTIELLAKSKLGNAPSVIEKVERIAEKDPDKLTKAAAVNFLTKFKDKKYLPLFEKLAGDSSYSVAGAALSGLTELKPEEAYDLAKKYSNDALGKLADAVSGVLFRYGKEEDFDLLYDMFAKLPLNEDKLFTTLKFCGYLSKLDNADLVKKGIDGIINFRKQIPAAYLQYIDPTFKQAFSQVVSAQKAKGNTELADYISKLIP
ncbi:MAG: M1 family metallopeptidase [Chitinophagaceae bacterium]|nr:M1 family metallopeptidase [Chitinophagaceae bacterium]